MIPGISHYNNSKLIINVKVKKKIPSSFYTLPFNKPKDSRGMEKEKKVEIKKEKVGGK